MAFDPNFCPKLPYEVIDKAPKWVELKPEHQSVLFELRYYQINLFFGRFLGIFAKNLLQKRSKRVKLAKSDIGCKI